MYGFICLNYRIRIIIKLLYGSFYKAVIEIVIIIDARIFCNKIINQFN